MTTRMRTRLTLIGALVLMGAGWGITQPFSKIAVTGGYQPFGLIFWQMAIGAVILFVVVRIRRQSLPFDGRRLRLYLVIALIGTVIPNAASFQALKFLPSGIVSILIALVPMVAFPVALMMGNDRFGWLRLFGLLTGLAGVILIIAPDTSLPDPALVIFVPLALVAPICYGFEGNYVAKWGTEGLDSIQVLLGASIVGALIALPLAVLSGHWISPFGPYGPPAYALIASAFIHAFVYSGYVWMVGRAGPSFAVQVSYLVTGFGVLWAMLLLGESYSLWVWGAMGLMFVGIFLVQPREDEAETAPDETLAPKGANGETDATTL